MSILTHLTNPALVDNLLAIEPNKNEVFVTRMIKATIREIKNNPILAKCSANSILYELSEIIKSKLELGVHAYLVPYGNICKMITSYKGCIELAFRSDRIQSVEVDNVYEGDFFEYARGSEGYLKHIPKLNQKDKIKICTYAIVKYINGGFQFTIIDNEQMENYKKYSKGLYIFDQKSQSKIINQNNPWVIHNEAMCFKTALKQLFKTVPLSICPHLHKIIKNEENFETKEINITPASEIFVQSQTENLIQELQNENSA